MAIKEFTVRDMYKALEANGFEHVREQWTADDFEGVIHGGCVLAQTGFNLQVEIADFENEYSYEGPYSIQKQLNKFKVPLKSKWYVEFDATKVGDAIMYWNDKKKEDKSGNTWGQPYVLKTYKAVAAMAYELLEPHFDKTIKLKEKEWKTTRKKGAKPFILEAVPN